MKRGTTAYALDKGVSFGKLCATAVNFAETYLSVARPDSDSLK